MRRNSVLGAAALAVAAAVPPDSHQELTLNVPVERPAAQNSRIEITLPDAFDAHSCTADEGWSCTVDNEADPEHPGLPQVTFTRVHCTPESSYRCAAEESHPDATERVALLQGSGGFVGVLHEPGEAGGGHDESGAPGVTFRFMVHTPAKAGDYAVSVVQRYNTGEIVRWEGEPGSKTPAPILHVG